MSGVFIPKFTEPRSLSSKKTRQSNQYSNLQPPPAPKPINYARSVPTNIKLIHSRYYNHTLDDSFKSVSSPGRGGEGGGGGVDGNDENNISGSGKQFFNEFFEIIQSLGSGSFGHVYKVKNIINHKYYAIKKSRNIFTGEADRTRQLREVQRIVNIPPNEYLINIIRAWEEERHLYLQMELCSMSLNQYLELNIMNHDEIWNVLIDILKALNHLHKYNLVHLDIKPDNIFLSIDYTPIYKLGDFGIVVSLNEKRDIIEYTEGDSRYLSLELLQGIITTKADIFSLGITMIEISCHIDLPKSGYLWHELRSGNSLPPPCDDLIPTDLLPFIYNMIQPNQTLRYESNDILNLIKTNKIRKRRVDISKIYIYRCYCHIKYIISRFIYIFISLLFCWTSKNKKNNNINDNIKTSTPIHYNHDESEFIKDELFNSSFSSDDDPAIQSDIYSSTPITRSRKKTSRILGGSSGRNNMSVTTPNTSRNLLKEFDAVSD